MTMLESHSATPKETTGAANVSQSLRERPSAWAAVLGLAMLATVSVQAQTLTVLYNFGRSPDGNEPYGKLLWVGRKLYGVTLNGGTSATGGTVFKLDSRGTETVVHSFPGAPDGYTPYSGLVRDAAGTMYGVTHWGGNPNNQVGTIFKVSKSGKETVLYSFNGYPTDGALPQAGLVRSEKGNLYGTTSEGGSGNCQDQQSNIVGCGTVFMLSDTGVETVLYSFDGGTTDGRYPFGTLILDSEGDLYGTTYFGGASEMGTVFKVTPAGTETVLYSFTGAPDGSHPMAGLTWLNGVLYGTTYDGGASGYGTVFRLTKGGSETVLHSFTGKGRDGEYPNTTLIRDRAGNLYGTTEAGGGTAHRVYCQVLAAGCGTIFKLTSAGKESVLHSFTGYPKDGSYPFGDLIRDAAGNLYGTTLLGGGTNSGTVFKLTP